MGNHDHPLVLLVERDFFFLGRVADQFEWETVRAVFDDERAAGENAIRRGRARADIAAEVIVSVTAHAIDVVMVAPAHQRHTRSQRPFDHIAAWHFIDIAQVGLKLGEAGLWAGRGIALLSRTPRARSCLPVAVAAAGPRAV